MTEANLRQIRVLHIVSAGGVASSLQPWLFMPLLTRLPRQRVKSQVACLSPGAVPSAVLRQNGVPTFDLALSRKRFSPTALKELTQAARHFRPDVIQAWGHTAQIVSTLVRKRCDWKPRLVWSISDTTPQLKNAGLIDRQKLKYAAKYATRADRVVYTSESAAAQHRRVGFPDGGHDTIPPGVDAARFKPDFAARRKLREELTLPQETFVIGMVAPFQPEFDHATFIKALGELVKTHPDIAVLLAGHGVQKGNAPLMALIGSGALSTRVHLLGEWSDISALYNACDLVCSSSVSDQSRMYLAMAMLCGVPCVGTGIGAQGELIGQHGIAIEPGNPAAFVKAITRVMQMTPEKRTHLAQGARKHALANYVYVRSLQKYLQLYYDLIGRQSLVTKDLPTPEVDATLTVPPALPSAAEMTANKRKPITVADLSDPDSLEAKVPEREPVELPKWRIEQEEERKKREAELAAQAAASKPLGDVLQEFEIQQQKSPTVAETPMTERARGVADETEELLPAEELLAAEPVQPVRAPAVATKKHSSAAPAKTISEQEAAKQAALKAARMAALQPIVPPGPVPAPKAASATTKPPVTRPMSSPATRPPVSQTGAASPVVQQSSTSQASQPATTSVSQPNTTPPVPQSTNAPVSHPATRPLASQPATAANGAAKSATHTADPVTIEAKSQAAPADIEAARPVAEQPPSIDLTSTQPLGALAQELANAALALKELEWPSVDARGATTDSAIAAPKSDSQAGAEPTKVASKADASAAAELSKAAQDDVLDVLKVADVSKSAPKTDAPAAELAKAAPKTDTPATGASTAAADSDVLDAPLLPSFELTLAADESSPQAASPSVPSAEPAKKPSPRETAAAAGKSSAVDTASSNLTEFGELALLATGEWLALQGLDVTSESKPETKEDASSAPKAEATRETRTDVKSASTSEAALETKSALSLEATTEAKATLESEATLDAKTEEKPALSVDAATEVKVAPQAEAALEAKAEANCAPNAAVTLETKGDAKPAAPVEATLDVKEDVKAGLGAEAAPEAGPEPTVKIEALAEVKADASVATRIENPPAARPDARAEAMTEARAEVKAETPTAGASDELDGPDALALISTPATPAQTSDPASQLALLPEPEAEKPKRAANAK